MSPLAVPLNDGVVSFETLVGWLSDTVGDSVSTTKWTGRLSPGPLPIELSWIATAVYSPPDSAGLALCEVHLPPLPSAVALATTPPSTLDPA